MKILNCLARVTQQECEYALHQTRQPLAILAWHDRLAPDKIGHVRGIHRVTLRLSAPQQGWDIRLLHEAEMDVDAPHPRGDLADLHLVLGSDVRDQLGDDVGDHDRTVQRSDVSEVPDHDWGNVTRESRQEDRGAGHARNATAGDLCCNIADRNL